MIKVKYTRNTSRKQGENGIVSPIDIVYLETCYEGLLERVKRIEAKIEEKQINEWKVAKVVFVVIGALGVLVGIIFTIFNYLMQ